MSRFVTLLCCITFGAAILSATTIATGGFVDCNHMVGDPDGDPVPVVYLVGPVNVSCAWDGGAVGVGATVNAFGPWPWDVDALDIEGRALWQAGSDGSPVSGAAEVFGSFIFGTTGPPRMGLANVLLSANPPSSTAGIYNFSTGSAASGSLHPFGLGVPFIVDVRASVSGTLAQPGFMQLPDVTSFQVYLALFEADGVTPVTILWDVPIVNAPEPRLSGVLLAGLLLMGWAARGQIKGQRVKGQY